MEAEFCVATLEDALARHDKPDIFNTDQGSQFTDAAFTGLLANKSSRVAHSLKHGMTIESSIF
jgi:putative transposase